MPYHTLPIVGAHFGPTRGSPSKVLISALAVGTPLLLIAEPENPADVNAVAVWLKSEKIPESGHALLEEGLPSFGFSLDQILAQDAWHLGYIPKEIAARLRAEGVVPLEGHVEVEFSTGTNGGPRVRFQDAVL